ncbi:PAS fold-containing protein [Lutibacter oricola]|uniref:PAS fold-containing protein n=1 Tax=Lutibacter oricola TaxID=762486 RepID=A0A1H2ZA24_9FLAO|nr:helix-turn-helix transcriptional regulator [Lutibacter oricola]SDX14221.1 PAS fold-containing protein [Lutibacter oricola]
MNTFSINSVYEEIFKTFPQVEIEEHIKKIIELDYYYPYNSTFFCITNTVTKQFEYISKNFTACTGLKNEDMLKGGMDYFWSRYHENDINLWLQCLQGLMNFTMNELDPDKRSKMSYTWNYRIKNAQGKFVTIIQNTTPIQFDKTNKPIVGLAHYTVLEDEIRMDICASAKYLNDKNEYETLYFNNISNKNLLGAVSNRERDIIRQLLVKKTSKEIAESLHISRHTVDTHRRNILKKFNLASTGELISYFKGNINLI